MTELEMIEKWAELAKDNMSKTAHKQMAENYEELAKHYEELAKKAKEHARAHRAAMSAAST